MRPIKKWVGFYVLLGVGFLNTLCGNYEIASAFFIAALFYEAIKQ